MGIVKGCCCMSEEAKSMTVQYTPAIQRMKERFSSFGQLLVKSNAEEGFLA